MIIINLLQLKYKRNLLNYIFILLSDLKIRWLKIFTLKKKKKRNRRNKEENF